MSSGDLRLLTVDRRLINVKSHATHCTVGDPEVVRVTVRRSRKTRRGSVPVVGLVAAFGLLLAACGSGGSSAEQENGENGAFYQEGDRVEVVVPFSPGGGTDTLARIVAPHLAEELGVEIVVQNKPAGGGVVAVNEFINQTEPDGKTILFSSSSNHIPPIVGQTGVEYAFDDFAPAAGFPIGGVIYSHADSEFTEPEDITGPNQPEQINYSGQPPAGGELRILLMFEMYEADINTALGFEGRGDARLAWEQGEADISYDTTPAYLADVAPLVESGEAVPLMSFGTVEGDELVRDPVFPDLPSPAEVYENAFGEEPSGDAFEAYKALSVATLAMNKGIHLQADAPEAAQEELAAAMEAIGASEEFEKQAEAELGGTPLLLGPDVENAWNAMAEVDSESSEVQWLIDWLAETYDVSVDEMSD
ncbi:MAG: hypothetical protein GEU93_10435 [Propionibacteriales bacterium]|nr:hypothetical protein [Propionibacteriales bacterium]